MPVGERVERAGIDGAGDGVPLGSRATGTAAAAHGARVSSGWWGRDLMPTGPRDRRECTVPLSGKSRRCRRNGAARRMRGRDPGRSAERGPDGVLDHDLAPPSPSSGLAAASAARVRPATPRRRRADRRTPGRTAPPGPPARGARRGRRPATTRAAARDAASAARFSRSARSAAGSRSTKTTRDGAPRQRLDPDRAGAGEEVEDPRRPPPTAPGCRRASRASGRPSAACRSPAARGAAARGPLPR